jgi:hypothetical protein
MIEAFRRDLGLKFAAVIIAIVLWFTFNYLTTGEATYSKTLVLPVAVQHIASGLVATVNVHQVTIELAGARPKLEGLTPDSFVFRRDLDARPGDGQHPFCDARRGRTHLGPLRIPRRPRGRARYRGQSGSAGRPRAVHSDRGGRSDGGRERCGGADDGRIAGAA